MNEWIRALRQRIAHALAQPDEELNRWQRSAKLMVRVSRHSARMLVRHKAPQMAAALSYRTLFSLVPLLVVAVVGARVFFGPDAITGPLGSLMEQLGLDQIRLESGEADPTAPQTAGDWIETLALSISQRLNFGAIGIVGGAVLIYAAISLLLTIEHSFNSVFGANRPRSFIRRLTNYWTLLTLGPAAILLTGIVGRRFQAIVEDLGGSFGVSFAGVAVTFVMSWLVLLLAYTVIPNRRVSLKPALLGSFVAILLWRLTKYGFGEYVDLSTGPQQLYGSLGLLPVFLIWIHLTWLIVLFGLELTASYQAVRADEDAFARVETQQEESRALVDPAVALVVMSNLTEAFALGASLTAVTIAQNADIPDRSARALLEAMAGRGLLHRVERGGAEEADAYALARAPDTIGADEVLRVGFDLSTVSGDGAGLRTLTALREAQTTAASNWSLASLPA